jgi:hypothetical protein
MAHRFASSFLLKTIQISGLMTKMRALDHLENAVLNSFGAGAGELFVRASRLISRSQSSARDSKRDSTY